MNSKPNPKPHRAVVEPLVLDMRVPEPSFGPPACRPFFATEFLPAFDESLLYPLRTIIKILFLIFSWVLNEQKYKIIPKETIV